MAAKIKIHRNCHGVLFDFDGVLCKDRFYEKTLLPKYSNTHDWIQTNIFSNKTLVQKWMRNQIDSAGINRLIAENAGKLFDIALAALGVNIKNSLIIDDSELTAEFYEQKGGSAFLYKDFYVGLAKKS